MGTGWRPPEALGDGRYVLGEELGRGGVGIVFAARDRFTGAERAIKLLYPRFARGHGRRRFANETRVLLSIDHPNVVRVFDAGSNEGTFWFAMERMPGGTVADQLRRYGPLPMREVVRIGAEILSGLEAVHAAGAVHRDLKPGNVLLAADGGARVADFGLVRIHDSSLTVTGSRLGSVFFVAPEQRVDPREVTPRTDLFSVGATLVAMVTGRRPPNLLLAGPEPEVLHPVPEPLRSVVRKAVAYDPAERHASAAAMRKDLLAAL